MYIIAFTTDNTDTLGSLTVSYNGTGARWCDVAPDFRGLDGRDIDAIQTNAAGTAGGLPLSLAIAKVQAALASTDVTGNVTADIQTIKTQTVTCAGGVTVPAATLASTVNITAGTITTVTTLTNNAIKKNVALPTFEFLMTDSTDHAPATGKTVACTRSIDGGAFGAGTLANTAELSNGIYKVDFATGDLNGGVITLRATATGCDDTFVTLVTTP